MRDGTIARNYAEALLSLATRAKAAEAWGSLITSIGQAVQQDERLQNFLQAPNVASAQKQLVFEKAFGSQVPRPMLLFLQKVIENRRQMLFPQIAVEYAALLDRDAGRIHARVTLAREASEADRAAITQSLSAKLGRTVVPHIEVDSGMLGGIIVRYGDTVMDGSVRRRMAGLRAQLLAQR